MKKLEKSLRQGITIKGFPLCFDSKKQYGEWLEVEDIARTKPIRKNICEDCTSFYKSQMIIEGRCTNIKFIVKG